MTKEFKVRIFCLTPKICSLIRKVLDKYGFLNTCVRIPEILEKDPELKSIFEITERPDVIILDKDIDMEIKKKIVEKFNNSKIICLPSLNDSDAIPQENVIQISEPFKLSELEKVLTELYNIKSENDIEIR